MALWRALAARRADGPPTAHAALAGAPTAVARDSLAALARAGDRVTWSGDVAAVAGVAEPVRDPSARTRLFAVADGAVAIEDSLGALDSLGAPEGARTAGAPRAVSGAVAVAGVRGAFVARERTTGARATAHAGEAPGRVLLLGRVGWEAKFTIAALEEAGWAVDARLRLADTVRVTQGRALTPTIGTHAAVVALDTAAGAEAAAIARFVRAGGGLVLAGEAVDAPSLAALAPAARARRVSGERDAFDGGDPRHGLPLRALEALRADALVLERRDDAVAVAARRIGAGRVAQSGYEESWRWRLQGDADAPAAHRAFWNDLVAAVAAAPTQPAAAPAAGASGRDGRGAFVADPAADLDAAPRAALVHRLGPPVAAAPVAPPPPAPLPAWIGALTLILLVAEWASRRARGAP